MNGPLMLQSLLWYQHTTTQRTVAEQGALEHRPIESMAESFLMDAGGSEAFVDLLVLLMKSPSIHVSFYVAKDRRPRKNDF
jgi:hypothetical protein